MIDEVKVRKVQELVNKAGDGEKVQVESTRGSTWDYEVAKVALEKLANKYGKGVTNIEALRQPLAKLLSDGKRTDFKAGQLANINYKLKKAGFEGVRLQLRDRATKKVIHGKTNNGFLTLAVD